MTIRQIAEACGLSLATVSRALRDDPRFPEETRRRVRETAERLGYRPNPLVSIFQAHVRAHRVPAFQANIAWIDDWPTPGYWEKPWLRGYLVGARARARQLGFGIEVIRLEDLKDWSPDINVRRFGRIMEARGIYGVILPLLTRATLIAGQWPGAVVELCSREIALETEPELPAPIRPRIWHKVQPDYLRNMHIAMRQLRAAGYRRPGLLISHWQDRFTDWAYKAGFLAEQLSLPRADRIPIMLVEDINDVSHNGTREWLERTRPDCLLCCHGGMRDRLRDIGWRVPEDIGLIHLNHAPDVADWAGVDERHETLGAAAVDVVVAQLQRNERGEPEEPRTVSVSGRWVPGKTLPERLKTEPRG